MKLEHYFILLKIFGIWHVINREKKFSKFFCLKSLTKRWFIFESGVKAGYFNCISDKDTLLCWFN